MFVGSADAQESSQASQVLEETCPDEHGPRSRPSSPSALETNGDDFGDYDYN